MTIDRYAGAQERWAAGASLVYGPIATELVALFPHDIAGHTVLDAGAGTGVASMALSARGAHPIAIDFSFDMLAWNRQTRPPAAVADICALPLTDDAVDESVAAFVLNHLAEPAAAFAELIRVTRQRGSFMACVYSTESGSDARDRIDDVARRAGWEVPDWYLELKSDAVPVLGRAEKMANAARAAGLTDVFVDERPVEVGVTSPEQLVDYRFGQAHFSAWLHDVGPARRAQIRRAAIDAARPIMSPYRPIVVFLRAAIPGKE